MAERRGDESDLRRATSMRQEEDGEEGERNGAYLMGIFFDNH